MRLFITYVEQDYFYAAQLADHLSHSPHQVLAYNPRWPDDYWQQHIDQHDVLVYLLSHFSDPRHVSYNHLLYAQQSHKPIVIINIDASHVTEELPYYVLINANGFTGADVGDILPYTLRLMDEQQRHQQQSLPIRQAKPDRPRAAQNRIRLRWEYGGQTYIKQFALDYPIILGRGDESDVVIPDKKISRTHASIYVKDRQRYLINLSETNYVYVEQDSKRTTLKYDEELILAPDAVFRLSDIPLQVYDTTEGPNEESQKSCPMCGRTYDHDVAHCPHDHTPLWYHKIYLLRTITGQEVRTAILESPRPGPNSLPSLPLVPIPDTSSTTKGGIDMRDYPQTDQLPPLDKVQRPEEHTAVASSWDEDDTTPPIPVQPFIVEDSLTGHTLIDNGTPATFQQYLAQTDATPFSLKAVSTPAPQRGIPTPPYTPFDEEITFVDTGEVVVEQQTFIATMESSNPSLQWNTSPVLSDPNHVQWPTASAFMPASIAPNQLYELRLMLYWPEVIEEVMEVVKYPSKAFGSTPRGTPVIPTPPSQPDHLYTLSLELPHAKLNQSSQQVMWPPANRDVGYQSASFLFNTPPELHQSIVGRVIVYRNALLVGQIPIEIPYQPANGQYDGFLAIGAHLQPLKPLFACFAAEDSALMAYLQRESYALDDRILNRIYTIRSEDGWRNIMLDLVSSSQAFQLFWNHATAQSPHCQREWQYALNIAAAHPQPFIYPVYWEDTLPQPPVELSQLRFQRVRLPSGY